MRNVPDDQKLPFYLRPTGLALVVLGLMVLKIWSGAQAHFVEDEAYYRLWGLSPALSYYDHPPMIGWWIWLGQQVFGDTFFGARALVIFSSVVGSLALWRTAALLFDHRTAGWAVLFLNTSILVGVGGILATPDAPSVLFWGLCLWALAELVTSRNANWWLAVGLFAGLGLLSKYSVLFLGAGLVLWLLWVPGARRWFVSWQLWAGGLIALLLFLPVLYWNHIHEWVSFYKQFGRAGRGDWTTKYIFEFLGALIGLMNPLIAVPGALGAVALARKARHRDEVASLLVLMVLPFLTYLLFHALHSRVQANWPAPLFPVFALMAAYFVGRADRQFRRTLSVAAVVLGLVVTVLVQVHAVYPISGAFGRKDPTFQLRGWPEIGAEISRIASETGAHYIVTTGYGLNGQLSYLMKGGLPVIQLNERIRYGMQGEPDVTLYAGKGLYVTETRRDRSKVLTDKFGTYRRIGTVPRTVDGTLLEDIAIYEISAPSGLPLGYDAD